MKIATAYLVLAIIAGTTSAFGRGAAPASPDVTSALSGGGHVPIDPRYPVTIYGGPLEACPDTIYLMGGPARSDGRFQTGAGGVIPDRQGWVGIDLTLKSSPKWKISTWNGRESLDPGTPGNHTMWCGEELAACVPADPPQGYGNGYDERLEWYGTVANSLAPTNVTIAALLNIDTEPVYDVLRLEIERSSGVWEVLASFTGQESSFALSRSFTVDQTGYVGAGHNQIHLRFRATSDGGWSDQDCLWPTYGHSNLDNILVTSDNGVATFDNFEGGTSNWIAVLPLACGDFSKVWPLLSDLDPLGSDFTPQFAFIDDGAVVPGTGGTPGTTWTYGPGGYTFNPNGGLQGPGAHVMNEIWSPLLPWPTGGRPWGALEFDFSVYQHVPLTSGIYYVWHLRASTDGGATWGTWKDDGFVYYCDDAKYLDLAPNIVSDLLPANPTHVQLALGAWDYGWVFGYHSSDVTPAPYFDNVRLFAIAWCGPFLRARSIDLFQDNFPAIGSIDYANLGNNSVRVDMARNISPRPHFRNDPGDSAVVKVTAVRPGSTLYGVPKMYYRLRHNPLFDPYRTSGLPYLGSLDGEPTARAGVTIPNSWRWDFPDTGFFFPGDILHYYIEAKDSWEGIIGTSRLPADTTGFSLFPTRPDPQAWRYPDEFTVRALPSMKSATPGNQPRVLYWDDNGSREVRAAMRLAFGNLGWFWWTNIDEYYTQAAWAGVGNGLGGRATSGQLSQYRTIVYSSGDLSRCVLSNGDFNGDPGNDIALMNAWLQLGSKNWLCSGDDLAYSLGNSGAAAAAFRNTWLPMSFDGAVPGAQDDVRPHIQLQSSPKVTPVPGNPLGLTRDYVVHGTTPVLRNFDALRAFGSSTRVAKFVPLSGPDYPYAATLYVPNAGGVGNRIVLLPYDMARITSGGKSDAPLSARAEVLGEILTFFGEITTEPGTGVPDAGTFTLRAFPNPFNPVATIEYNLPADGDLSLRLYDLRGRLVRVLHEGPLPAGRGRLTWDGKDGRGQNVASGIYFCEAKAAGKTEMRKVTLVR